jgi:pseudouridine-5'-phosphate glycosidase
MTSLDKSFLSMHPEVAQALSEAKPIVALESTVITHGLPYPQNLKLARDMEQTVRQEGCTPATIAILDGRIWVGLTSDQLEALANKGDKKKISTRDIAPAVARRRSGGTTVAGTLAIAQVVGIKTFATGGIGGVHRGAPFDVSADLAELARAELVVVCAGAKAILDIPATLEVLETYGVPVVGYQVDEFPAFYSVSSGMAVSTRVDSAMEAAELAHTHWQLGLGGCILVAVAPPKDVALEPGIVESAIRSALKEAGEKRIHGQNVTPFLLSRVSELTGGASLRANLGLLLNNARVAGKIAMAVQKQSS